MRDPEKGKAMNIFFYAKLSITEPPKLSGPSALIIVARQLWSNSHYNGSSSSKASIEATQSGIEIGNTHTKAILENTKQNISYISELQRKFTYYKPCSEL